VVVLVTAFVEMVPEQLVALVERVIVLAGFVGVVTFAVIVVGGEVIVLVELVGCVDELAIVVKVDAEAVERTGFGGFGVVAVLIVEMDYVKFEMLAHWVWFAEGCHFGIVVGGIE
jgi:hypothetical protein